MTRKALLALFLLALFPAEGRLFAEEGAAKAEASPTAQPTASTEIQASQAVQAQESQPDEFEMNPRGGSFSFTPAFLLPASPLDRTLQSTLGYNLDFDIGFTPRWSVIFGAGYYNLQGKQNPDYYLMMAPAWFGIKSKEQFLPLAEVFWEMAGVVYYEKAYLISSSVGAQENLDGGVFVGGGGDIWWSKWFLTGFNARLQFAVEDGQVFPFVQFGFRVGIRG